MQKFYIECMCSKCLWILLFHTKGVVGYHEHKLGDYWVAQLNDSINNLSQETFAHANEILININSGRLSDVYMRQ